LVLLVDKSVDNTKEQPAGDSPVSASIGGGKKNLISPVFSRKLV
jgi:hypothetical protein